MRDPAILTQNYILLHRNSTVAQNQFYLPLTGCTTVWHDTRDGFFCCAIWLFGLGDGNDSFTNSGFYGELFLSLWATNTSQTPRWADLRGKGACDSSRTLSWDNAGTKNLLNPGIYLQILHPYLGIWNM